MIYLKLFSIFFIIGLFTFGGGYAMISLLETELVYKYEMVDLITFKNMIAISESTPGPLAINMATFTGYNIGGVLGSFISTVSVILPSFIIILLIAMIMKKLIDKPVVKAIINGFQAVVVGLIFATALYLLYSSVVIDIETFKVDFSVVIMFVIIILISIIYKLIKKKSISPYMIILSGGLLGLVYYLINLI